MSWNVKTWNESFQCYFSTRSDLHTVWSVVPYKSHVTLLCVPPWTLIWLPDFLVKAHATTPVQINSDVDACRSYCPYCCWYYLVFISICYWYTFFWYKQLHFLLSLELRSHEFSAWKMLTSCLLSLTVVYI